jgi:hypothetical protein
MCICFPEHIGYHANIVGEIERLTGRMNYLNQRIEMSTINSKCDGPSAYCRRRGVFQMHRGVAGD